jgi:GalNAc-alpha-(1->4)-GalNAc-alpha-(1->3)-diNAcBac-PP-undecaprenol alpha-1,4-N-acetyl-D-galactosaminyltransferase
MSENGKRKLCLVIPSLQAGGMERVMSELAGFFDTKSDIEEHLVLYGKTREIFYPLPGNVIMHMPSFVFNNELRFLSTLKTIYYLRKTINQIKPDSILSFGELWNSFVLLSLLGLKYPVYISDRCSPERRYSTLHLILRRLLYREATGILAQTETARAIYRKQFKHKNIKVIGNPIREVKPGSEDGKENIVLMVGRLIESKNQDKLIELFLKIDLPGWKLVLVGYDHLQQNNADRLLNIIRQNQAEDKVLLEGKQTDVDRYYRITKIFAFTSSSEGFPNVIGEAMSAGLPVVAFDCIAGPSDMIRDGINGYLVPVFDYEQFREKLELLMKDDKLRQSFGKRAQEDIKQFSIDKIGEQFYKFILNNY